MKPTLLLTGAAGYVGSFLARTLDSHYRIIPWTRAEGDLSTEAGLSALARVAFDRMIHGAAGLPRPGALADLLARNERMDRGVFALARDRGIPTAYLSGCSMYDLSTPKTHDETSSLFPKNDYHRAKAAGDALFRGMIVVRISSPVDPMRWPPTVLSRMRNDVREKGEATVFGLGRREQDFVHLGDVAAWLRALLESGKTGAFNACSSIPITMRALAEKMASHFGPARVRELDSEEAPSFARFDSSKIVAVTGHVPSDPARFLFGSDG